MDKLRRHIVRGLLFLTLALLSFGVACGSAAVDSTPRPPNDASPPAAAQLVESEPTQTEITQLVESEPTQTATAQSTASPPAPTAQASPTAEPEGRIAGSKPTGPFKVELAFGDIPDLGREVQLIFKVTPVIDIEEGFVEFHLPEGFEVVTGDILWTGPLAANQTSVFTLTVKATSPGDWQLTGAAVIRGGPIFS